MKSARFRQSDEDVRQKQGQPQPELTVANDGQSLPVQVPSNCGSVFVKA
jgi:hypothetical protein